MERGPETHSNKQHSIDVTCDANCLGANVIANWEGEFEWIFSGHLNAGKGTAQPRGKTSAHAAMTDRRASRAALRMLSGGGLGKRTCQSSAAVQCGPEPAR